MLHYFATIPYCEGCDVEYLRSSIADESAVYLQLEVSDWINPSEDLYPGVAGNHEKYFHAIFGKFKNFRILAKLPLVDLAQKLFGICPGPGTQHLLDIDLCWSTNFTIEPTRLANLCFTVAVWQDFELIGRGIDVQDKTGTQDLCNCLAGRDIY